MNICFRLKYRTQVIKMEYFSTYVINSRNQIQEENLKLLKLFKIKSVFYLRNVDYRI
jgi:hypothetical protein